MSYFSEHRLLNLQIADLNKQRLAAGVQQISSPKQLVGTSPRSAQMNAANQLAIQDANSVGETAPRPTSGLNTELLSTPLPGSQLTPDQITAQGPSGTTTPYTAPEDTQAYRDSQLANAKYINPAQNRSSYPSLQSRLDKIDEKHNALDANGASNSTERANEKAIAIQQYEAEQRDRDARKARTQTKQSADMTAKGTTEVTGPTAPPPGGGAGMAATSIVGQITSQYPELLGMQTQLEEMLSGNTTQLDSRYAQEVSEFNSTDRNQDGVSDGIAAGVSESKQLLAQDKAKQNAINTQNRDIGLEAAKLAKDMAEIAKAKFELQQVYNENKMREQNIDAEIKNRRVAARMGITADTNGLKWMGDEIRRGNEALAFFQQAGDLQEAEFALQTGRQYNLDVKQALNAYDANQLQIDTMFRKDMAELDKTLSLDATERKDERKKMREKYWDKKAEEDSKAKDRLKDFTLKLMEQADARKKAQEDATMDEGDAMDMSMKLQDRVNGLEEVKSFSTINSQYQGMLAAQEVFNSDPSTKGSFDTALVKLFEKILDPTSVVRQEEFNSQLTSQGIVRGTIQGAIDAFNGGKGLDPKAQAAMISMSEALYESAKKTTNEAVQPALAQVLRFNSRPGANIGLEEILNPKVIEALDIPVDEFEAAELMLGGTPEEGYSQEEPMDTPQDMRSWISTVGNGQIVRGSPFHTGVDANAIDIDGEIGDPVRPVVAGVVTAVNDVDKGGYGISVVVRDAQGVEHLYAHLSGVNVKQGQKVGTNTPVGKMGNSGNVIAGKGKDGAHLHYRASMDGKPVTSSLIAQAQPAEVGGAAPAPRPAPAPIPAPAPAPARPMQGAPITGQTIGMGGGPNLSLAAAPIGAYREISTGKIIYPTTQGMVDFYKQRPSGYQDLTAPAPVQKTAPSPQIAGGKKIDLISSKR